MNMKKLLLSCMLFVSLYFSGISAQNLVLNPGFENWSTGPNPTLGSWTITQPINGTITQSTTFSEGTKSCRIAATAGTCTISQSMAVTAGKTYSFRVLYNIQTANAQAKDARISCNFRTATSAIAMSLEDSLALKGPGGITGFFPSVTGVWKTYTYDVVAPTGATAFVLSVTVARNAIVLWDDFALIENTTPTIYKYTYDAGTGFNYAPSMSGFNYAPNAGPSAEQSLTVKASNLTGSLTVAAPINYEISIGSGTSFSGTSSMSIPATSGKIAPMTFYIRLKSGLSTNTYSGNVTLTSTGAVQQTIPVTGTVAVLPVIITPSVTSLSGFSYTFGSGPSAQQSLTVTGSGLTSGITVSVPSYFELSVLSDASFSGTTSMTLPQTAGSVASTTIYVRLKSGLAIGIYPSTISLASTGGTTKTVALTGTVNSLPGISTSVSSLTGMNYLVGAGPSAIQSVTFSAASLTTYLIINASANFEISTDGGGLFTPTGQVILSPIGGIVSPTLVYVRLKSGLAKATYSESIVGSSTGVTSGSVTVSGSVSITTGTKNTGTSSIMLARTATGILIDGVEANELVTIYTATGMKIMNLTSKGQSMEVTLAKGSIYLIHSHGKATKIVL